MSIWRYSNIGEGSLIRVFKNDTYLKISIIIFTYFLYIPPQSYASCKYWVFFKDKGDDIENQLVKLRTDWPEASLSRRYKAGCGVDEYDLPIKDDYLDALRNSGLRLVHKSRWLNAVSVELESEDLEIFEKFKFVSCLQKVAPMADGRIEGEGSFTELSNDEIETILENLSQEGFLSMGDFGISWQQAAQIRADEAHMRGFSGAGVMIGILDTGFDLRHRALAGIDLVAQYDFVFNDDDPSWDPRYDPYGQASHGTACLSVIAGYDPGFLCGIAPKASFALAKTEFTGSETSVEEDYWVAGLEWLEWLGVDVVSSSLTYRDWYNSYSYDGVQSPASRAAQRASYLGVIICNSAGNNGPGPISIGAPADAVGVLAIAAVDSNGILVKFSSRGPTADGRIKPDLAAKGLGVVCVSPLTWNGYARWNGTSLACPLVAGTVALAIEANPDWHPAKIVEALKESASEATKPNNDYGWGIVDCIATIEYPRLSGRIIYHPFLGTNSSSKSFVVKITSHNKDEFQTVCDLYKSFSFPNLPYGIWKVTVFDGQRVVYERDNLIIPPSLDIDIVIQHQP